MRRDYKGVRERATSGRDLEKILIKLAGGASGKLVHAIVKKVGI